MRYLTLTTRYACMCKLSIYLSHVVEVAMRHGLLAGRLVDVVEQRVQLVLGRQVAQSSVAERLATQHSTLPTFDSSLSMVVVISAHLPTEHSLFHARVPLSATEASLSPYCVCASVYRLP